MLNKEIKGALIVSCQALADEPLHSSFIMSKMALAAKQGGAKGIRANSVVDIRAIRKEVDLPIIVEGMIDTPAKVQRVLELGAYSVVVGSVITRPQKITEKFVEATKIKQNQA